MIEVNAPVSRICASLSFIVVVAEYDELIAPPAGFVEPSWAGEIGNAEALDALELSEEDACASGNSSTADGMS